MVNTFETLLRDLNNAGVAQILLPFFLVFTIVYATLQKVHIFGEKDKKFNIIVAVISGLAVVFPHVLSPGSTYDVVPQINNALPIIMLILVALLSLGLLIGLFSGKKMEDWTGGIKTIFNIVAIVAVIYIFLVSSQSIGAPEFIRRLFYNAALVNTIIALIVFGVVINFITGSDDNKKEKKSLQERLFGDK